jgi:hypothetical protein
MNVVKMKTAIAEAAVAVVAKLARISVHRKVDREKSKKIYYSYIGNYLYHTIIARSGVTKQSPPLSRRLLRRKQHLLAMTQTKGENHDHR